MGLFQNMATMTESTNSDLILTEYYGDNNYLVTGISERGRNVVALVQEHGATAHGMSQCSVTHDMLQWAFGIHRGLRITRIENVA